MSWTWRSASGAASGRRLSRHSTTALIAVSLAMTVAHAAYQYAYAWSPFQRLYLSQYVYSRAAGLVFTTGAYRVLHVISKRGNRLALPAEVELSATGEPTMEPTPLARQEGVVRIAWVDQRYEHRWLHDVLRDIVYDGQRPIDLVRPSLWILPAALVAFLAGNLIADIGLATWRRRVRRFRGPSLVSAREFNRRLHTTGLSVALCADRRTRRRGQSLVLQLPTELESRHMLVMGGARTGSAALIGPLLEQIRARGDTAIVYDPTGAHVARCYDPARGDVILNPLDTRSPCWNLADEIQIRIDALALAAAFVPPRRADDPFVIDTARHILTKLLTHRPTGQALAAWLTDREECARRLGGTLPEVMTTGGVVESAVRINARLEGVRHALALLPTADEASGRWSTRAWGAQRDGWLFLTGSPSGREDARPLTTLWLDMLLRRLQVTRESRARRVWAVLDGVDSLDRLTHLQGAIEAASGINLTVILGCQSWNAMDAIYGPQAEPLLSQPAIKLFLRAAEPKTAQWASEVLGRVDVEHLREVFPLGSPASRARDMVPLVLPSDLASLPPLRGYLQVSNLVARLDMLPELALTRHEPFAERLIPLHPPYPTTLVRVPGAATGHTEPAAAATAPDDEPFFR